MLRIGLQALCFACLAGSPLFSQETLNVSRDLVRLGIASADMTPDRPLLDSSPLLQRAIQWANNQRVSRVIADPGVYYFASLQGPDHHINLGEIRGVAIDFQGSELRFANPLHHGFSLFRSADVTIQNVSLDYQRQLYTQVRITAVDAANMEVRFIVEQGWPLPVTLNALLNPSGESDALIFVYRNGRPWPGFRRMSVRYPFTDDRATVVRNFNANPDIVGQIRVGDVAVLGVRRGGQAMLAGTCDRCTYRNIRVYSGTIGFNLDGQSSLAERIYIMPKPGTDRLVSTMADGISLTQPGPNNTLRLSRSIRALDDGISPHIWAYGSVQSYVNARTIRVQGDVTTALGQQRPLANGSVLVFQRPSDGAILGNALLTSQASAADRNGLPQAILNFERDLPANLIGSYAFPADGEQRGSGLLLERNTVQEHGYFTGISVWGTLGTTVRGNYLRAITMGGISMSQRAYLNDWITPPVGDLGVANNVIDGVNTTLDGYYGLQMGGIQSIFMTASNVPGTSSVHRNFAIRNNFIAAPARSAVWAGNVNGATIEGNYFLHPNNNLVMDLAWTPFRAQLTEPVGMDSSQAVGAQNNTVDKDSLRLFVTDSEYRELVAYAPGRSVRLNAYNLGKLVRPSATVTDADGSVLQASIQAAGDHALDVVIPPRSVAGGAVLTLTAGGTKYIGTLFLDALDNLPVLNGCTYQVSPSAAALSSAAGTLSILVITQSGCGYQILTSGAFASPPTSGTGTGVVSVAVTSNGGAARSGTVDIAGQIVSITQAGTSVVPTIQAIYDPWNYATGVAPGSWVTIAGTGFTTSSPQTWNLTGTQLPTSLQGTRVTFNRIPAPLLYVSQTQINALVPATVQPGAVEVLAQSNGVNGSPYSISVTPAAPAVYALPGADGQLFVTSALAGTSFLVGNQATDSRVVRAVFPDDTLDLYMIGLGETADPARFNTSQSFSGAYPIKAAVQATVGGKPAPVIFAGLTSPGLYLVRIKVPLDLTPGPNLLRLVVGGIQTSPSLNLMVSQAPANMLRNGGFEAPLTGSDWRFFADQALGVRVTIERTTSDVAEGAYALLVRATAVNRFNDAQLWQGGVPVRQGAFYTVRFRAKTNVPRAAEVYFLKDGGDFRHYGLSATVQLGAEWQDYVLYFRATETASDGRLNFYFGDAIAETRLDSVSVQAANSN